MTDDDLGSGSRGTPVPESHVPPGRLDPARVERNRELWRQVKPPTVILAIALALFTIACIGFGFMEYNNNPVELENLTLVAILGTVAMTALGLFWFVMLGLGAMFRGARRTTPHDE